MSTLQINTFNAKVEKIQNILSFLSTAYNDLNEEIILSSQEKIGGHEIFNYVQQEIEELKNIAMQNTEVQHD